MTPSAIATNRASLRSTGRRTLYVLLALALVAAVFAADVATGTELSVSLFYLLPVAIASWLVGRGAGLAMATLSGAGWYAANLLDATRLEHVSWILGWNVGIETGVNVIVALAVDGLRRGLERQRAMARAIEGAFQRLDREHREVGALQRELLPARPPDIPGWEFAVHYTTSTRAGGDYYDFFALPDGRMGLVIADASGHGAPAAVVMAMLRALLHTAPEALETPSAVLESLGRRLFGNMPAGVFATACWITLDPTSREIEYALAGHCPPFIARADGMLERLDSGGGLPLGIMRDAAYPCGRVRLEPGDTLFLFTDGLTEAIGADDEMFGDERLRAVLATPRDTDAASCSARVLAALDAHRGGVPVADDVTWLVVRAPRPSAPAARPDRPAVIQERSRILGSSTI
jgi:serine phosphatase RsbU (regulator of sigma subunit)